MKIERKSKVVKFKEIKGCVGTCFNYQNKICMIIPTCYLNDFFNDMIIALDLKKSELIFENEINNEVLVTILNLKIVEE